MANWYEATLMHPVTADPRISGVPYSPIALRAGVDWPERILEDRTGANDRRCVCGAKHNDDRAAAQRRCATRVLWMMMQHGVQ